jgi:hypothetical protein
MLSKIIKEKFPQQNSIQYNTNKTYALCLNNTKSQSNKPLKFFVYSIKTDKIILEDSLPKGKVKWLNENQIEVTSVPGIVRGREGKENQENGYIFDLKLQKKINKFQIDRQK